MDLDSEEAAIAYCGEVIEYESSGRGAIAEWTPTDILDGLDHCQDIARSAANISHSFTKLIGSVREMYELRCAVDLTVARLDQGLEQRKHNIETKMPMLERQLDNLSDRIDRLLDEVLKNDPGGESRELTDMRMKLMEIVMKQSSQLQDLMVKIIAM